MEREFLQKGREKMGEYTDRTRRKLTETWTKGMKKKGESLSQREKEMLQIGRAHV